MKSLYIFLLFAGCILCDRSYAQNVAINQTGSNPDTSAMLDISSTTKGLLIPRMTTVQEAAIPTPATGLMLFNTTTNTFQANMGTSVTPSWGTFSTAARNNFVLVKSAADLPAPVGGVITLVATTLYSVNGTIVLTSKLDLNGAWITGSDAVNDKLVYTPTSGELFTGSSAGNIRNLTLMANGTGGKLFNLDALGANKNFIVQNCYFILNKDLGKIKGYGGSVYLQTIACFYNTAGITFENDNNVIINNTLWDNTNSGTYETYTGTFNVIQKIAGAMQVNSPNAGVSVAGVTSINYGELKIVLFTGTGSFISGTFSKQWEVEAAGLNTEKDDVAAGNLYLSIPSSTITFAGVSTPVKLSGTTTSAGLFRVTSPSSNRLQYSGTKSKRFTILASFTITATSNNKNFSFYIYKNGVKLPESEQALKLPNSAVGSITISCTALLAAGDYIELWGENTTDGTSITLETMNMSMK